MNMTITYVHSRTFMVFDLFIIWRIAMLLVQQWICTREERLENGFIIRNRVLTTFIFFVTRTKPVSLHNK